MRKTRFQKLLAGIFGVLALVATNFVAAPAANAAWNNGDYCYSEWNYNAASSGFTEFCYPSSLKERGGSIRMEAVNDHRYISRLKITFLVNDGTDIFMGNNGHWEVTGGQKWTAATWDGRPGQRCVSQWNSSCVLTYYPNWVLGDTKDMVMLDSQIGIGLGSGFNLKVIWHRHMG